MSDTAKPGSIEVATHVLVGSNLNAVEKLAALRSAKRKPGLGPNDALIDFLHGVNAPKSLVGFVGVAIRAHKILNSDDRQLLFSLNGRQRKRWRKALRRAIANAGTLADQIFEQDSKARELFLRIEGDNPLMDAGCMKKHSCFGMLWHSYPDPGLDLNFLNLQAVVLGAHLAIMPSVLPVDQWLAGTELDKGTFESLYHACLAARQFIRRYETYRPFLEKLPRINLMSELPKAFDAYVSEIEEQKIP